MYRIHLIYRMKKSNQTLLWVLSIIIVAVLAYWIGKQQDKTQKISIPADSSVTQTVPPAKTISPPEIIPSTALKPKIEGNHIYTNSKYNFTLELPERWKEYRVTETKSGFGDSYSFELKHTDGSYGSVFIISAHPREVWDSLQADAGPKPSYLGEKNAFVFGYSYAHDDSNFAGFGEPTPGLVFKGPLFDAQEIIIPSFEIR